MAAILDPRYKMYDLIPRELARYKTELGKMISLFILRINDQLNNVVLPTTATTLSQTNTTNCSVLSYLNRSKNQKISGQEIFNSYQMLEKQNEDTDVVEFWSSTSDTQPILRRLAFKYWTVRPSSVDAERLFSAANQILTDQRNRLLPENAGDILFIKENKHLRV